MQGANAVLNVITLPPGASATQARLVMDGVRGAIFFYVAGGPVGALAGSWASSAGTDPYGNVYPQGLMINIGIISGTSITFSNGFLSNGDGTYTSTPGFFLYSGTPAAGNLIKSSCSTAGHDKFNNNYLGGDTEYDNVALEAVNIFASVITWYSMSSNISAVFTAGINMQAALSGFNSLAITSPAASNTAYLSTDAHGNLTVLPGSDNITYIASGIKTQLSASNGPTLVNGSFTAIGTSFQLSAAIRYRIKARVNLSGGQAGGKPIMSIGHGGTAALGLFDGHEIYFAQGAVAPLTQLSHVAGFPADFSGNTMALNVLQEFVLEATILVSTGGTMFLSGSTDTGGDTCLVQAGWNFSIEPIQ